MRMPNRFEPSTHAPTALTRQSVDDHHNYVTALFSAQPDHSLSIGFLSKAEPFMQKRWPWSSGRHQIHVKMTTATGIEFTLARGLRGDPQPAQKY